MKAFTENLDNTRLKIIDELKKKIEEQEEEIQRRIIENTRLHQRARTLWEEKQYLQGRPPDERDGWQPKKK
jgi:vacuolar-type H+-ATPase subunit E/Vma4